MKFASALRIGFIALVGTAMACAHHERPTTLDLQLDWKATNDATSFPPGTADAFTGQSVTVSLGADHRANATAVGKNIQDATKPVPITTKGDVGSFIVSHFASSLQAAAVKVVPAGATRLIKVDVEDFFAEEENRYNSRVTVAVTLTDGAGASLWTGTVHGTSSDWGRTLDPDSYLQSLSNATLDAVVNLCKTPDFMAALKTKS